MNKNDIKLMSENYKKVLVKENGIPEGLPLNPPGGEQIGTNITHEEYAKSVDKINSLVGKLAAKDPIVQQIWDVISNLWGEYEDQVMSTLGLKTPPPK